MIYRGGNRKDIVKSSLKGGALAVGAHAIGDILPTSATASTIKNGDNVMSTTAMRVVAEGTLGGVVAKGFGDKFHHGFWQGAIGEIVASLHIEHGVLSAVTSGTGAMCTAIVLKNDNLVEAFLQGVFIDCLNHAAHEMADKLKLNIPQTTEDGTESKNDYNRDSLVVSKDGDLTVYESVDGDQLIVEDGGQGGMESFWSPDSPAVIQATVGAAQGVADFIVDSGSGLIHVAFHPVETVGHMYEAVKRIDELPAAVAAHYRKVQQKLSDSTLNMKQRSRIIAKESANLVSLVTGVGGVASMTLGSIKKFSTVGLRSSGTASSSGSIASASLAVNLSAEKLILSQWSARPSAYVAKEVGGKIRLVLDRNKLASIHESGALNTIKKLGFKEKNCKLPGDQGFDIVAFKETAGGAVEKILLVECKATANGLTKGTPAMSTTKHGKQMSSGWIAEKLNQMYKQGGDLRQNAEFLRQHLDRVQPVLAYQRGGFSVWNKRHALPEFRPVEVEALLHW